MVSALPDMGAAPVDMTVTEADMTTPPTDDGGSMSTGATSRSCGHLVAGGLDGAGGCARSAASSSLSLAPLRGGRPPGVRCGFARVHPSVASFAMPDPRIVAVDDNQRFCEQVVAVSREVSLRPGFSRGSEALPVISCQHPELLVADLLRPGSEGAGC